MIMANEQELDTLVDPQMDSPGDVVMHDATEVKTEDEKSLEKKMRELEAENERLANELATNKTLSEKRVKDTQAAMHKATAEVAELRKQLESDTNTDFEDDFWNDESDESKTDIETSDKNKSVKNTEETVPADPNDPLDEFMKSQEVFVKTHPDYDEFVTESFINVIQADPVLKKQWIESQRTPDDLYSMAKCYTEALGIVTNYGSDSAKNKVKIETKTIQQKADQDDSPEEDDFESTQLSMVNSQRRGVPVSPISDDPLDFL